MGFGTVFLAYMLILNIAYFSFTDLICALMLLLGAYKLSAVEKSFKSAVFVLIPFSALGLFELAAEFARIFGADFLSDTVTGFIGFARYILIGLFSYFIIVGIERLSLEVDLPVLLRKAKRQKVLTLTAFAPSAIFEIPILGEIIPLKVLAVIAVLLLVFTFAVTVLTLLLIYSAYMHICMPSELVYKERPSKLGFVNKFREHEAKKRQEYADYKLEAFKKGNEKKSKKGKK